MRFDRELTLRLFRLLNTPVMEGLPVLMYHSVSDDREAGVGPYYRVSTSPKRFSEQLRWLSELGYTGVSLEQALATLRNGSNGVRLAAITFDDGFRDFYTAAWPALQRHKFTATMYLPTAFISTQRNSCFGRECLTWNEVRDLYSQGVRFGSHTVNHPKLYEISWMEIERELTESKTQIEQELGETVSSFAYPFAFPQEDRGFAKRFVDTLQACGYQSCATTVIGRLQAGEDLFFLKRLPVNECDDKDLFAAKLAGDYDWMAYPQWCTRQARAYLGGAKRAGD